MVWSKEAGDTMGGGGAKKGQGKGKVGGKGSSETK